jgi:hypothetical protein
MIYRIIFLFGISLFIVKSSISAQSSDTITVKKIVLIKKIDGGEFIGEIISNDDREILIKTKTTIGRLYISKSDISSISFINVKEKEQNETGEFRAEGPFTTRYYFTNNALPIKRGENYAFINLFGPEVHFAVTDNLNFGLISSWIGSPITLVSKLSIISAKKLHISVGNIIGSSGYLFQGRALVGLHWGTLTIGDRMRNISFSAGYGYFNDKSYTISRIEDSFHDALFLGLGGIAPIGEKASFILDGMLISNSKDNPYYDGSISYNAGNRNRTDQTITNTTLILMPGMRFYKSYAKAFQISLAGVFFKDNSTMTSNYNNGTLNKEKGKTISFPVPTISWLRKF